MRFRAHIRCFGPKSWGQPGSIPYNSFSKPLPVYNPRGSIRLLGLKSIQIVSAVQQVNQMDHLVTLELLI